MKHLPAALALLFSLLLSLTDAYAGRACDKQRIAPHKVAAAAQTAMLAATALDEADAPVALIARVGTDLSKQGLAYSHAGFAVRDHAHGRWTVVHLLNECGSDRSSLYAQGLVNFFSDDLINQDLRIVWLKADVAKRLAERIKQMPRHSLHDPHYNLIARPGSRNYQNSTAWIVEMMASALANHAFYDRNAAYAFVRSDGFVPDTIHVPYSKRVLGGLFSANAAFTDHSVGTRLSGDYPVITVRSIFRYLDQGGYVERQQEWRGGQLQAQPGPA